jgi:hypothetical protein
MKTPPMSSFTPEQEVLLWAIRVDHTEDQRIAEILEKGVDWDYIRQTAIQQGIIPLLYRRLTEKMGTLVPADEIRSLKRLFMENAANNLRMTQELHSVLDFFTDAGIEAMPFKGPVLAVQAYGDLSMRSFCDVDILIYHRDFLRTYDLLLKSGYSPALNRKQAEFLSRLGIELTFNHPRGNLDIHWALTPRYLALNFDLDQIFGQSVSLKIDNREIRVLSPEDALLFHCIHNYHHRWSRLKWIADIIFLIYRNPSLNWKKIGDETFHSGAGYILRNALHLAKNRGGITYPEVIEAQLRVDNSANSFGNRLFLPKTLVSNFSTELIYLFKYERAVKKSSSAFYYLNYYIIPPKFRDIRVMTLPEPLFPLYCFIRPFRVLMSLLYS